MSKENSMQNGESVVAVGLPGNTILQGRYRIDTAIGMGGFGITYRAYDMLEQTIVAIKEYFPSGIVTRGKDLNVSIVVRECTADYLKGIKRFLQEAKDVAKFRDNPNIVKVKGFFEDKGTAYMVMEYLDGVTLGTYIERAGGRIDDAMAIQVIFTLMDTLGQVHQAGLIHRDISPDNVFVCRDSSIRLIDFGAAKVSSEMDNRSAAVVLKQGYAPVEQYSTKGNIGPWTDVYAFGAMMYFMLTGVKPPESIERMMEDDIIPPRQLNPKIPENVERVIMRALQLNTGDRYQNMPEMRASLLGKDIPISEDPRGRSEILRGTAAPGQSEILKGPAVPGQSEILKGPAVPGQSEILKGTAVPGQSEILRGAPVPGQSEILKGTGMPVYGGNSGGKEKGRSKKIFMAVLGVALIIAAIVFFVLYG